LINRVIRFQGQVLRRKYTGSIRCPKPFARVYIGIEPTGGPGLKWNLQAKREVNQLNPFRPDVDGVTRIFLLTRLHTGRIISALEITVRSDWDVAEKQPGRRVSSWVALSSRVEGMKPESAV